MRLTLSLFGGSLLELELDTGQRKAEVSFGFTGGPRCESIEIAETVDPLADE